MKSERWGTMTRDVWIRFIFVEQKLVSKIDEVPEEFKNHRAGKESTPFFRNVALYPFKCNGIRFISMIFVFRARLRVRSFFDFFGLVS